MSLTVKIIQFRLPKAKSNLIGRVEFRGVAHTTSELNSLSNVIDVNQSFIWPLARPASSDEHVIVELRSQTTKILLKTAIATTSKNSGLNGRGGGTSENSRGTISSNTKSIGRYEFLMQGLVTEGRAQIEDRLVDASTNRSIDAVVVFEAKYVSPDDAAGNFQPTNVINSIQQQQHENSTSLDDDQQMLLDIEKNIENLERNINRDGENTSNKKRTILKRVMASSTSTAAPGQSSTQSGMGSIRKSPSKDKKMTLRTVRNLMRFNKSRHQRQQSRDSSTEDEGRSPLITESEHITGSGGGHTSASEIEDDSKSINESLHSNASNEHDDYSGFDQGKMIKAMTKTSDHLKSQDFQLCITIIEARQLPGLNMDPVVCVQVGDQRKYTSVKESTNCPYFNEYFVFDFYMPPVMLFDKIITLSVYHSRKFLRSGTLIGSFKIDLKTVYDTPDHQFYHKWALLSDPEDFISGPKGYLKCDIGIIGKGDTVKVPQKSEKDADDIEANLLLPDGVPIDRQRAKFIVKIYRADGLPRMNSSIMANVKKAFTGESRDLVSPYVQVSFAGLTGKTTLKKNAYAPVWNEQLVFTEMFPPLCQRIKIQLRDADPVKPSIIGTHYIDLKKISNDGEKGFLPTFGPSFIHLYGSTRDYSLLEKHSNLNTGLGEGVSFRARLLIAIRTEITDNAETTAIEKNIELEPTNPISESSYSKNEEFFLFSTILEASMIDKKVTDKTVFFELSLGNAGNSLDGHNESVSSAFQSEDEGGELETIDTTSFSSTTSACKPISHDKSQYYLPYWDYKPCMDVRCTLPDLRRRMYNSNMIAKMTEKLEDGLNETYRFMEEEDTKAEVKLRLILEELATGCAKYLTITKANITGPGSGKTKLDKERMKLCEREIETLGNLARNLRALVTKNSMRERYKTAQTYLQRIRFLIDDPQDSLPDIFIWLIANGKRYAYHRFSAKDLIFSTIDEESGEMCGKVQTIFLKLPGKQAVGPTGWFVQAKLSLYLWLGVVKHKLYFYAGLPKGYDMTQELRNADRPNALAPSNIHYLEKHFFQLRAHIYQARSLIGSDASGLSDPFATVFITEFAKTTQVIEETLSPTWDELLVFEEILIYGAKDEIKRDPPTIIVEIYDQDKVGKSEFIGRAIARPRVKLKENAYVTPNLEWFDVVRGTGNAGELLAAFELLELGNDDLPRLTEPRFLPVDVIARKGSGPPPPPMTVLPVPREVRPHLAKFRLEVLFWGLRDLKRVHLMSVDKPRIDVECSGKILSSSIIQNAKKNPNFPNMIKSIDLELPVEENYAPPITIRCVDCRSFGRYTLVGTHQITSIHRYMYRPPPKEDFSSFITMGGQIILAAPSKDNETSGTSSTNPQKGLGNNVQSNSAREIRTLYGAVSVSRMVSRSQAKKRSTAPDPAAHEYESDDESDKDWWTKYFASYEKLIEDTKQACTNKVYDSSFGRPSEREKGQIKWPGLKNSKFVHKVSPKHPPKNSKRSQTALCHIYPNELEAQFEFNNFKDWLHSFPLYRGKKTGDSTEDDNRIVGYFKGAITVYKLPLPKGETPLIAPSLPTNDPIHVMVRVYIIKATDLHPMDLNGKADPYIVLQLGGKRISDKDNYVSKQLNPIFGRCFEIEATFPQDSMLTVQILDWDLVGADDMIGETKVDLENRFYSKHRATCGLPLKYEENPYTTKSYATKQKNKVAAQTSNIAAPNSPEKSNTKNSYTTINLKKIDDKKKSTESSKDPSGYNRWREPMKPTQILSKLCKDGKLESPHYYQDRVVIGKYCMTFSEEEVYAWNGPTTCKYRDEHLALAVLQRWHEIPKIGCKLVPEHIESRPLYNPEKPGIEQGKIEMWVDMFPMDMPLPGPSIDISPRKPKSYELRVIIWNTDEVVLEDDAFFTGEKMSDIYVKGWLTGPQDCQSTDIHYRSLTGEGNFNWRFIYPFDYLAAEEKIVLTRRESLFSWDETEVKIPARLELQVWDADHFSADDFLGAISLNLNRFPRGAKSAKLCTLDMLKMENIPTVNIFKQKRVRGWWPFSVKKNDDIELTGKVEAEFHLLTKEEAEQTPAGFGRNEPDPLEKPNRPDSSFMWFLNPFKSLRYIVWQGYKWTIIKIGFFIFFTIMLLLFFYSVPGYTVKKMLGV